MLTFSYVRPSVLVLAAMLIAMGPVTSDVAVAADLVSAPDTRNSDSAGTLKIKPDRHDFGKVIVPLTSSPLTVTVTNNSKSASIEFTTIVAAPPFSIQSDQCSGFPLTSGNSCKVDVWFHPTTTGKVKDKKALTFTDSAKKSPQHIELSGQGIVGATPTATATPTMTQTSAFTPTATATKACFGTCTPTATPTASGTPTITPSPKASPSPTGVTPTATVTKTPSPVRHLHRTRLSDSEYRASCFDHGRSSLRWHSTEQCGNLRPGRPIYSPSRPLRCMMPGTARQQRRSTLAEKPRSW